VNNDRYDLKLAFDSDAAEFARGVEIGMLYDRLRSSALPVHTTIHASNAEMVLRLGEAFGCQVHADELDADWLSVEFCCESVNGRD
jgi:hypothetical protein